MSVIQNQNIENKCNSNSISSGDKLQKSLNDARKNILSYTAPSNEKMCDESKPNTYDSCLRNGLIKRMQYISGGPNSVLDRIKTMVKNGEKSPPICEDPSKQCYGIGNGDYWLNNYLNKLPDNNDGSDGFSDNAYIQPGILDDSCKQKISENPCGCGTQDKDDNGNLLWLDPDKKKQPMCTCDNNYEADIDSYGVCIRKKDKQCYQLKRNYVCEDINGIATAVPDVNSYNSMQMMNHDVIQRSNGYNQKINEGSGVENLPWDINGTVDKNNCEKYFMKNGKCLTPSSVYSASMKINNKSCPNNCTGNGSCDTATGTCICNKGFKGDDCSEPDKQVTKCKNDCSGHGICKNDVCDCNDGWTGKSCSQSKKSPQKCNKCKNGVCDIQSGICICYAGYKGDLCNIKTNGKSTQPVSTGGIIGIAIGGCVILGIVIFLLFFNKNVYKMKRKNKFTTSLPNCTLKIFIVCVIIAGIVLAILGGLGIFSSKKTSTANTILEKGMCIPNNKKDMATCQSYDQNIEKCVSDKKCKWETQSEALQNKLKDAEKNKNTKTPSKNVLPGKCVESPKNCGSKSSCQFVQENMDKTYDKIGEYEWKDKDAYSSAQQACSNNKLSFCNKDCVTQNPVSGNLPTCKGLAALTSANWECLNSDASYGYMGCESCNYMNSDNQSKSYSLCTANGNDYINPCTWQPDN